MWLLLCSVPNLGQAHIQLLKYLERYRVTYAAELNQDDG
jgi:hypothetical protein